jgi:hypothetical protein
MGVTMSEKSASVLWSGAGKKGLGKISTESGALMDWPASAPDGNEGHVSERS